MENFYNKLISFLEKSLSHRYWYIVTGIVTALIIWLLTAPSYYALSKDFKPCNGCVIFQDEINRADHLFKPTKYPEFSHMANTQLRITVPIIAKLIGTRSKFVIFGIQEILGVAFLVITCLLSYRLTQDKIISAIVTLSIGFIYVGKSAFVDVEGLTDSFAFFFLILALFTRIKPLVLISLLFAYFTDERAMLASSLVAIFYFLKFLEMKKNKFDFYSVIKAPVFYVLLSWILYFLIRIILFKLYGLYNPISGVVIPELDWLGYIIWDGLQGFWLLVALGIIYLIIEKRFFILSLLIIASGVMVISTSMVYDLTRSIAYIFPVIFVSLFLIEKAMNKSQLRKIVMMVCLINFLCGDSFFSIPAPSRYYRSVPIKIIEKFVLHEY